MQKYANLVQIANSNEYLLAKIGVDTAENEPLTSLRENSIHYSFASLAAQLARNEGVESLFRVETVDAEEMPRCGPEGDKNSLSHTYNHTKNPDTL